MLDCALICSPDGPDAHACRVRAPCARTPVNSKGPATKQIRGRRAGAAEREHEAHVPVVVRVALFPEDLKTRPRATRMPPGPRLLCPSLAGAPILNDAPQIRKVQESNRCVFLAVEIQKRKQFGGKSFWIPLPFDQAPAGPGSRQRRRWGMNRWPNSRCAPAIWMAPGSASLRRQHQSEDSPSVHARLREAHLALCKIARPTAAGACASRCPISPLRCCRRLQPSRTCAFYSLPAHCPPDFLRCSCDHLPAVPLPDLCTLTVAHAGGVGKTGAGEADRL